MTLKTTDNILTVFELAIVVLSLAGWAALGFPEWKPVAAFGLLCIAGTVILRWVTFRKT
jgi:hypothetical protein